MLPKEDVVDAEITPPLPVRATDSMSEVLHQLPTLFLGVIGGSELLGFFTDENRRELLILFAPLPWAMYPTSK